MNSEFPDFNDPSLVTIFIAKKIITIATSRNVSTKMYFSCDFHELEVGHLFTSSLFFPLICTSYEINEFEVLSDRFYNKASSGHTSTMKCRIIRNLGE